MNIHTGFIHWEIYSFYSVSLYPAFFSLEFCQNRPKSALRHLRRLPLGGFLNGRRFIPCALPLPRKQSLRDTPLFHKIGPVTICHQRVLTQYRTSL